MKWALAMALLALSGCCNIMTRPKKDLWVSDPYECTCEAAAVLAIPFQDPTGPEGSIAKAYATLLFPVFLVNLPFEAAVDTVFLPWDSGWWLAGKLR